MALLTNRDSILEAIRQEPAQSGPLWIKAGYERSLNRLIDAAKRQGVSWRILPGDEFDKRFHGIHSHVCLEKEDFTYSTPEDLFKLLTGNGPNPVFSALDGVVDPQNLGNILRTAACFSLSGLIVPKDRACPVNDTVLNIARGGAALVPIARVTNLAGILREMKKRNIFCYGLDERADKRLHEIDLSGPICLVFGGEEGLRRLTKDLCDELVSIPSNPAFPTLNVATSFAVANYEALRQQKR